MPAVLSNCTEGYPARAAWGSDLSQLAQQLSGGVLRSVYATTHDDPRFGPFYDHARPLGVLPNVRRRARYAVNATLDRVAFLAAFGRGAEEVPQRPGRLLYMYTGALAEALGPAAENDLDPGLDELLRLNPARSSINLWIGQPGVTTPCHYDGYHNLYVQLHGTKRFLLLPPALDRAMNTFPFLHPSYGQCQRVPLEHFGGPDVAVPRDAVIAELGELGGGLGGERVVPTPLVIRAHTCPKAGVQPIPRRRGSPPSSTRPSPR